jgi:acyl-coenzyme A synthetase/AMP-(fatty) acid ligase
VEMPKQLEIRQQLPRTAAGKLSRLKLREEVLSQGR